MLSCPGRAQQIDFLVTKVEKEKRSFAFKSYQLQLNAREPTICLWNNIVNVYCKIGGWSTYRSC